MTNTNTDEMPPAQPTRMAKFLRVVEALGRLWDGLRWPAPARAWLLAALPLLRHSPAMPPSSSADRFSRTSTVGFPLRP